MSKRLSSFDFDKLTKRWNGYYTPIDTRETEGWRRDWSDLVEDLPYLRIARGAPRQGNEVVHQLHCHLNLDGNSSDAVKADFQKLWELLSRGTEAYHCIEPLADGFQFHYAALNTRELFVTGSMQVSLRKAA